MRTRAQIEHALPGSLLGGKTLRSIGPARATLHLNWKAATRNPQSCHPKEARIQAF